MNLRKKYTPQLYIIVLPYIILTTILLYFYNIDWLFVGILMFLFGILGNGIGGHRLIAHKQFNPANWVRQVLYSLCTLAAFAPIWYWNAQHIHHHKFSDTLIDIHSPKYTSIWNSFFGWALQQKYIRVVARTEKVAIFTGLNDHNMKFYTTWNYKLIWGFIVVTGVLIPDLLLAYFIYYWIEIVRLGLITSVSHMDNIPFNYRNFNTIDDSKNNLILGYITFGFAWHNNHHANPNNLDTQVKWWEFDLEAKFAKLLNGLPGKRTG